LKKRDIPYEVYRGEDHDPNPNHKTWPKIYSSDGKFVGGYGDLQKVVK